jgi:DNA invertase Pin-like site-specific DNA recombinase
MTPPAGKKMPTVFAGVAEFERSLFRERTGAGRMDAKKRGVEFDLKPQLTREQIARALRLVDEDQSVQKVADAFGAHETTIYRCLSAADAAA